jgi:hypothetical protein
MASWYIIAWRLLWFIPLQLGRALFVISAFMGWGLNHGQSAWDNTR